MLPVTKTTKYRLVITDLSLNTLNSIEKFNLKTLKELNSKIFVTSDQIDLEKLASEDLTFYDKHFVNFIRERVLEIIGFYMDRIDFGLYIYLFDERTYKSFFKNMTKNLYYKSQTILLSCVEDKQRWFRGNVNQIKFAVNGIFDIISEQVEDSDFKVHIPNHIIWEFYISQFIFSFKATKNYAFAISPNGEKIMRIGDRDPLYE